VKRPDLNPDHPACDMHDASQNTRYNFKETLRKPPLPQRPSLLPTTLPVSATMRAAQCIDLLLTIPFATFRMFPFHQEWLTRQLRTYYRLSAVKL
jgi:hypothetical protein